MMNLMHTGEKEWTTCLIAVREKLLEMYPDLQHALAVEVIQIICPNGAGTIIYLGKVSLFENEYRREPAT